MKVWCSGWKKQRRISGAKSPDDWKTSPGKLNNWEQCGRLNYRRVGGGGAYCSSRENVNTVMVQHFLLWIPDISPPLCASKSTLSLMSLPVLFRLQSTWSSRTVTPYRLGVWGHIKLALLLQKVVGSSPCSGSFHGQHLQDVEQSPTSVTLNGENSRQSASLPVYWRLCGFLSFVSSFLKTRTFLGCLLIFPQFILD